MFFMFGGSFSQGQTSRLWSTSSYPWMSKDSASKDIEINSANASKASKAVVSCWLEGLYFDVIIWLDCAINATACRRGHSIHPPCWSDGVAGLSLRRFPVVPCGPCILMVADAALGVHLARFAFAEGKWQPRPWNDCHETFTDFHVGKEGKFMNIQLYLGSRFLQEHRETQSVHHAYLLQHPCTTRGTGDTSWYRAMARTLCVLVHANCEGLRNATLQGYHRLYLQTMSIYSFCMFLQEVLDCLVFP